MYDVVIPFNAVNYASFQPIHKAIRQYGVGYMLGNKHKTEYFRLLI